VPDILWWALPGGRVQVEGHGPFDVEPFGMTAYPVTWAQYRAFLEDCDGYRSKRWRRGLTHGNEPGEHLWAYPNYPAINVFWFDAMAFCRWLSERRGKAIRLPDEWEWQWAAQSAEPGYLYPWGEEWRDHAANTDESGIGRTIAVGVYPAGRSHQGVYDLAGNVWEWCRNAYDDPNAKRPGKDESRVLRGGSWINNQDNARADNRNNNHPNNRNNNIGFRVVCSSHIHLPPPKADLSRRPRFAGCGGGRLNGAGASRPHARSGVGRIAKRRRRPGFGPAAPHPPPPAALRIHPPRSRPTSATMRLTWAY
jgi:hypothetical protein